MATMYVQKVNCSTLDIVEDHKNAKRASLVMQEIAGLATGPYQELYYISTVCVCVSSVVLPSIYFDRYIMSRDVDI